jgi:hypothetical protein
LPACQHRNNVAAAIRAAAPAFEAQFSFSSERQP